MLNDPLKIIWKYKNNDRYVQYKIYIFVGKIPNDISTIIEKFKHLDLYHTLILIDKKEEEILIQYYGEYWYSLFFNVYHQYHQIDLIKKNVEYSQSLTELYGNEWYKKHIDNKYSTNPIDRINTTYDNNVTMKLTKKYAEKSNIMIGGDGGDEEEYDDLQEEISGDEEDVNVNNEIIDDDIENILNKYNNQEMNENMTKKTNKELEKIVKKVNVIEFDKSNDNELSESQLEFTYDKEYVYDMYIYKDDTINLIKQKISIMLENNNKFAFNKLLPKYIYMWITYKYDEYKHVRLGKTKLNGNKLVEYPIVPETSMYKYENLEGSVKILNDNIVRDINKNMYDVDTEETILSEYNKYISNNDLYIVDVINEFGKKYILQDTKLKNIINTYINIYYPEILENELLMLMKMLNATENNMDNELITFIEKLTLDWETINNNILSINDITNIIENVNIGDGFNKVNITLTEINYQLIYTSNLDLFRIFTYFKVNEMYPFVQYRVKQNDVIYSFHEETINKMKHDNDSLELLTRWIDKESTNLIGISLKMKYVEDRDKYATVKISKDGNIKLTIQWKHIDNKTVDNIADLNQYIYQIVNKMNNEQNVIRYKIPNVNVTQNFNVGFINAHQVFNLKKETKIDHNKLSNLCRLFYPYFSVVIDPKKRIGIHSKDSLGKYGTYLRFKRVSNYNDIKNIRKKILYYVKNYEQNNKKMIDMLCKQFNVNENVIIREYKFLEKELYKIRKSRNELKTYDNEQNIKYKKYGVNVGVYSKNESYVVMILGTTSVQQLNNIIKTIDSIITLYERIYVDNDKQYQKVLDKLKVLVGVAERRNKVYDRYEYVYKSEDIKKTKEIIKKDKERSAFKPKHGENQYTRACQNSGAMRKRPLIFNKETFDDLTKKYNYVYNKKSNIFEKKIKSNEILKSVKMMNTTTGDDVHYICDPMENGEYKYLGFLTKSKHPDGLCMLCCFKKNPIESKNKKKKLFYDKCSKSGTVPSLSDIGEEHGNILYIFNDLNKIYHDRLYYLPKSLDFLFNTITNNDKIIKNYYLKHTDQYYFKYGINQFNLYDNIYYIISHIFNKSVIEVIDICVNYLRNNSDLFIHLNSGSLKNKYVDLERYINELIQYNINSDELIHMLSIPGVMYEHGLNIIIFNKIDNYDDFKLIFSDQENIHNILKSNRKSIILIKYGLVYYPIVNVRYINEIFTNEFIHNFDSSIVNMTYEYILESININVTDILSGVYLDKLTEINTSINVYNYNSIKAHITSQYIDVYNKCSFLVYDNKLLPVRLSGSIYPLNILYSFDNYVQSIQDTINFMKDINIKHNMKYNLHNVSYIVDSNKESSDVIVYTLGYVYGKNMEILNIPIHNEKTTIDTLRKVVGENIILMHKTGEYNINKIIANGKKDMVSDKRTVNVFEITHFYESYELFKFELSNYINEYDHRDIKKYIIGVIQNEKLSTKTKKIVLKLIFYKLTDNELYHFYLNNVSKNPSEMDTINNNLDWFKSGDGIPLYSTKYITFRKDDFDLLKYVDYKFNNIRNRCQNHDTMDKCNIHPFCCWDNNKCTFSLVKKIFIDHMNRCINDIVYNETYMDQILNLNGFYVSDIVSFNIFSENEGQRIIKKNFLSSNDMILKIIGSVKNDNPLPPDQNKIDIGEQLYDSNFLLINPLDQIVNSSSNAFLRAFSNCFIWNNFFMLSPNSRNIGYESDKHKILIKYFKGLIIDWIYSNELNKKTLNAFYSKYFQSEYNATKYHIEKYVFNLMNNEKYSYNDVLSLFILSIIFSYKVILLENMDILFIFDNHSVYKKEDININENELSKDKEKAKKTIYIKYTLKNDEIFNVISKYLY